MLWYVMPFVEGETLRSRLAREGRLPVDVALQLAREMADALEYAHRHGVVHRDVKPENVLLQSGHALVADFGIALALEHAGGDRLTRTGITLGTPQYMAPEQAAGDRDVDARTDVYALGAVLHEMLAGESPFAAESQHAMLRRMMHEAADGARVAPRRRVVVPRRRGATRAGEAAGRSVPERGGVRGGARPVRGQHGFETRRGERCVGCRGARRRHARSHAAAAARSPDLRACRDVRRRARCSRSGSRAAGRSPARRSRSA